MAELSKEFFDTAGWEDINQAIISDQGNKDEKRVRILQAEYAQAPDKSLLGDIKKQAGHIGDFKGSPAYTGLDVELKNVDYNQAVDATQNPINIEAIKVKEQVSEKEDMSKMSFADLSALRTKYAGNKEKQIEIAPFEHRAYARETVEANPHLAPVFAGLLIPGYQAAKLHGVAPTSGESGLTPASMKQVTEGLTGVGEGLYNRFSPELLDLMGIMVEKKAPIN